MPRSRKSRYSDAYRTFLDQLIAARKNRGITQVELASRMSTSQSMLSKLEKGVVRMDITDMLDYLHGVDSDPLEFMRQFIASLPRTRSRAGNL